MNSISTVQSATTQFPVPTSVHHRLGEASGNGPVRADGRSPQEVREAFTQFVGQTFFGQMIKAMRSTVGKPAYFHGGRGEEVFQSQLDQTLADHLTEATAEQFTEPLFRVQFPHLASEEFATAESIADRGLSQLSSLARR